MADNDKINMPDNYEMINCDGSKYFNQEFFVNIQVSFLIVWENTSVSHLCMLCVTCR